jgi:FkbM family methyltransferase
LFKKLHKIKEIFSNKTLFPKPFRYCFAVILRKSGFCRFFIFENKGIKYRFHPTSFSQLLWAFSPDFEDEEMIFFQKYLQKNDILVDIGANVGTISLTSAKIVGENGKIFAFEPSPKTFDALLENIALNGFKNCEIFPFAVGNENKRIFLSDKKSDDQNQVLKENEGFEEKIKVNQIRLDDFFDKKTKIDVLKIDTEGFEFLVLQGAEEMLKNTECIYFEAKNEHFQRYGTTFREVFIYLENQNFYFFKLNKNEELSVINQDFFPEKCENIIAVKNIELLKKRLFS